MHSQILSSVTAMLVCIALSAYFSATETAFSSANRTRLKALAEKGNKRAATAYTLLEDYDRLISTILIGNNIVNISVASIGTVLFVRLYGDAGATLSTVVVTIVVLIFGEITPKSIAKDYPERFAMFSAPMIRGLIWLMTPLNFLFSQWKRLVGRLFHSSGETKMSQEELLLLLEEVQQEGSIDENEGELLRNAVEFSDLEAQDILTHRVVLEAVDVTATREEVAEKFTETRYSRLLVFDGTIDRIVGVVHQKDLYVGSGMTDKPLREIMAPPVFVPQTEKVDDLLRLLQSSKSHMAIVVDEYGGTLGIVTMEDILEELVGEIWDEHDEVEEPVRQVDEDTYLVDCTMNFSDFCDRFSIRSDSGSVSLGGWVMQELARIPREGDQFTYQHVTITVLKTGSHRVEMVEVALLAEDN